jgi:hypothetical protein
VMRVTSIGAASFTAARLRDDTAVTVLLDASTVLKNGNCHAQPAQEMLTALREGSVVKVKGKRDREHGTIEARTITILPADHAPGP